MPQCLGTLILQLLTVQRPSAIPPNCASSFVPQLYITIFSRYRSTPLITYLDITYFSGIKYFFHLSRILMYTICVRTFGYKVPFFCCPEEYVICGVDLYKSTFYVPKSHPKIRGSTYIRDHIWAYTSSFT